MNYGANRTPVICVLMPRAKGGFTVSNVGKPLFWPHDGDTVQEDEVHWLERHKGWTVIVKGERTEP